MKPRYYKKEDIGFTAYYKVYSESQRTKKNKTLYHGVQIEFDYHTDLVVTSFSFLSTHFETCQESTEKIFLEGLKGAKEYLNKI